MPLNGIRSRRVGRRCRQRLSLTKKRYRDQVEADMAEMSSMSESEIHAMMKEQARMKKGRPA
jgi:hypothetical protein